MVDQAYNDETQRAAIPHVRDGQNAVDQSRTRTHEMSNAQKYEVWGGEQGPEAMRHSSAKMFSGVSDVLAKENALITRFIAETEHAMEAAKQAEWDAKYSFDQVAEALKNVSNSDEARQLNKHLEDAGFKVNDRQHKVDDATKYASASPDEYAVGGTPDDAKVSAALAQADNQTQKSL